MSVAKARAAVIPLSARVNGINVSLLLQEPVENTLKIALIVPDFQNSTIKIKRNERFARDCEILEHEGTDWSAVALISMRRSKNAAVVKWTP